MTSFRTAIAAALTCLMLSGVVWAKADVRPLAQPQAPLESEMSDTVKAAIIGIGGILFGILLTFSVDEYRARRDRRRLARSLASAFIAEIVAQAHWCKGAASVWNVLEHSKDVLFSVARATIPPQPRAYEALASQIYVFEAATTSSIITFYGAVDVTRTVIETAAQVGTGPSIKKGDAVKLAERLRRACFLALLAIRALEPLARIKPKPNDAEQMAQLMADLEKVAGRGVLAEPVSEAIQKMEVTRQESG